MTTVETIKMMNPTKIILTRKTRVEDGPNVTWGEEVLLAQEFGIYNLRRSQNIERVNLGGEIRQVELMLLCQGDADIKGSASEDPRTSYDEFTYGDRNYRVVYVREYQGVRGLEMKQAGCVGL